MLPQPVHTGSVQVTPVWLAAHKPFRADPPSYSFPHRQPVPPVQSNPMQATAPLAPRRSWQYAGVPQKFAPRSCLYCSQTSHARLHESLLTTAEHAGASIDPILAQSISNRPLGEVQLELTFKSRRAVRSFFQYGQPLRLAPVGDVCHATIVCVGKPKVLQHGNNVAPVSCR